MQIFVIPINPQAWNTPPFYPAKKNGKMYVAAGQDQENQAFKEAVREELASQKGYMIPGPYDIRLALWRRVEKGRKHVDLTNMQKLIEDALQGVIIENDSETISFKTEVVDQSPDAPEFFIVSVDFCKKVERCDESWLLDELFNDSDNSLYDSIKPLLAGQKPKKPTQDNAWPPI